jgi:hypothetical protein
MQDTPILVLALKELRQIRCDHRLVLSLIVSRRTSSSAAEKVMVGGGAT